jgi:hypothetical protein
LVREWGLKKIGSHLDGHSLNEFYSDQHKKWICVDISESIYFLDENDKKNTPWSILELFSNSNTQIRSYSFNASYSKDEKKIYKFYFSNQYEPFVIDKYVNQRYDKYLSKYKPLPIPIVHGILVLFNKSYVYKKIVIKNQHLIYRPTLKNKTKSRILKLLDVLPERLGYWIYHRLQLLTLKDIKHYLNANKSSLKTIQSIVQKNKIELKNENIVEIGSGWFPIIPLLFKEMFRVNSIYTFDINKHYSKNRILESTKLFSETLKLKPSEKLPEFISYFPYTPIQKASFNYNPKLIFSRFVLEHIKHNDLLEIKCRTLVD